MDNFCDFLRPHAQGRLEVDARAASQGRTLQLWEVAITNDQGRLVAKGRVRLANATRRAGRVLAGLTVSSWYSWSWATRRGSADAGRLPADRRPPAPGPPPHGEAAWDEWANDFGGGAQVNSLYDADGTVSPGRFDA